LKDGRRNGADTKCILDGWFRVPLENTTRFMFYQTTKQVWKARGFSFNLLMVPPDHRSVYSYSAPVAQCAM